METLRCLVCQGQSIADSDAEMAGDMRALVRERIATGESPQHIREWLVQRYGDYVTYDPPFDWLTAAAVAGAAGAARRRAADRAPHLPQGGAS